MRILRCVVTLVVLAASIGFGPGSTAIERVREGIRHFNNGDFAAAGKAFTEADVASPENATIALDRACALAATGDVDRARELFQQAALARDTDLAARAHYNLGCLSAEQGRAVLGNDPLVANTEQRQQGLSLLLAAVGHFRDCLKLDAGHADARHNLELIRLFMKHIQALWEQQDREKARDEMGLLEFLAMIERRQSTLRSTVRALNDQRDSPQRRHSTTETATSQSELRDEIDPLKEKIAAELQTAHAVQSPGAGGPSGQVPPENEQAERAEQVQRLLTQLADEADGLMADSATHIESARFDEAAAKQRDALERLNQIFMAVAPFSGVLQRAVQQQEHLTAISETTIGESVSNENNTGNADKAGAAADDDDESPSESSGGNVSETEYHELEWQQAQVTDWSRMLSLKAQSELPGIEAQLQAAQTQPGAAATDNPVPDDAATDPHAGQQDPSVQLEAVKQSLQRAIELGPEVVEHSGSASERLGSLDMTEAFPDQQEALKLLREIAEPLAQQNQQNQQQDDPQDGNGENQSQQPQPQEQQQSQQQKQQQAPGQNQPQTGQSPQERAMSVLRRARERERQHRDLEKQLQQIIGGRAPVDRDW